MNWKTWKQNTKGAWKSYWGNRPGWLPALFLFLLFLLAFALIAGNFFRQN